MLVWTCPLTHRVMVGPVAPDGVPAAGVDEDADPNKVWWNPRTKDADTTPERPSEVHLFDPVAGAWVDPISDEERISIAEIERTRLLRESDHTQLADYSLGNGTVWRDYRQRLRNMTFEKGRAPTWPTPPTNQGTPE